MVKFTISTDSCADIFKSGMDANGISYIILKRITNGVVTEEIYDSYGEFENFYTEIKKGALPTTSLLNEYELSEYFTGLLQKSEGDIIHVALSGGLSNTCDNAVKAAEKLNQTLSGRKIYVIDSLSASRGMAMMLDRLIGLRDGGMTASEAVSRIEHLRGRQQVWAVIGDLRHLKRGGRLSGFKATVGTLLKFKPILVINSRGKLAIEKTVRGEKKSVEYLLSKMETFGAAVSPDFTNQTVYIMHSSESSLLAELEAGIKSRFAGIKISKGMIGPIIGTHVGPGTVAVIFEGAERLDIN